MSDITLRLTAALAGRYKIEREIGAGGMATVYLAEDIKHHRNVAIKVLRPEIAASLGSERFLREIKIAAGLHHPHILALYDSGAADGFLYYVMPFVEGESLRARLNREKQLPLEDALQIAREVADALGSAHSRDVVHRDIKPENILLEGGHAVVADFGVARAIRAASGQHLTETGMAIGTPAYMSPEQASGEEVDGRSDLYSLGTMLHEMLAGEPPFTGPTMESVVHQHLTAEAPLVTTIRPAVPAAVASAVQRALAKAAADRFSTAGRFADALKAATSGEVPRVGVTRPLRSRLVRGVGVAVVLGAALLALWWIVLRSPSVAERPRLVVLPFENLGAPDDEYFADGITEEITSRLARVSGFDIIARTSALLYKNTDKTAKQIGEELEADYLLEGTVRWSKPDTGPSRIRVSPQLIRTSDETHVWAQPYEEVLADIFQVQVDIAEQVARALDVTLLEPERRALAARPTENLDAYDAYLQGNDYLNRPVNEEYLRNAGRMYDEALALDTAFALAAARLSMVHSRMFWYFYDRTEARLIEARAAAEQAVALAPDLLETHLALAEFYYRGRLDYDRALQELAIAGEGRQHDSELQMTIGTVQRRQGKWEEAAQNIARASELEPIAGSNALQAGITYLYVRNYAEAERHFDRAISLAPDQLRPYVWMARTSLTGQGDTARVRALLVQAERADREGLDPQTWWHWALYRTVNGASEQTLERLAQVRVDSGFYYAAAAELYGLMNRPQLMRAYHDSARIVFESRARERPSEARFHSDLGIAYAGLGRKSEAIREGKLAVELLPISKEALRGSDWVRNLAQVYVMVGDYDAAVEQLGYLLSVAAPISQHWLRLDPIWNPLREHPGFQRLVVREQ